MTETLHSRSVLRVLHQRRVTEDEIDALGHLSVPFYDKRALEATQTLLAQHGLNSTALLEQNIELTLVDAFRRNYREQFLGADLEVQGGVLDVENDRLRLYLELINPEHDERSATFVHTLVLQDSASRQPVALNASIAAQLSEERVDWPEHGRSRSLDLTRMPFQLELSEAIRRDLSHNEARTIQDEECNQAGFLEAGQFQHLPYSGTPSEDSSDQWVFDSPDGRRLGIADLETRNTLLSLPRSGDRIQAFSADVDIARKTFRRGYWVFNLDSSELLTAGSIVMVLLDLEARRAAEITADIRKRFEDRYHPDLS